MSPKIRESPFQRIYLANPSYFETPTSTCPRASSFRAFCGYVFEVVVAAAAVLVEDVAVATPAPRLTPASSKASASASHSSRFTCCRQFRRNGEPAVAVLRAHHCRLLHRRRRSPDQQGRGLLRRDTCADVEGATGQAQPVHDFPVAPFSIAHFHAGPQACCAGYHATAVRVQPSAVFP